jgi:ERCC4-type nuclease
MMYLTSSANDRDLRKLLTPVIVMAIPYGDVIFNGRDGDKVMRFCVERKKWGDLCQCIDDGRQLNQMRGAYENGFDRYVLVVEGGYKVAGGNLYYRRRGYVDSGMPWTRIQAYLDELHYFTGVQVKHTSTARETAQAINNLHDLMQSRDHNSLKKFYSPPVTPVLMRKPGIVRRVAKEFMGIGWDRSLAVEKQFPTLREMVNAGVEEWMEVEGIGKNIAYSVVKEAGG